ncbi:MAG TPA: glycosyltransferase family 4 protein [Pyrinomonadaceae bacterium]|nr:glycosyltransferase family 4 protein [Pyrinomonadaceae bacterium]
MHVGFVATESPYGDRSSCGIAAYLRAMIPALLDAGHRVTLFANSKENRNFRAEDGQVPVYHLQLPSLHWYAAKVPGLRQLAPLPLRQLEWSTALYRRVARVAASTKFDVLESTETGALFLSRIAPLVIRLHGSEYAFRKHAGKSLDSSVRWNDSLEANSSRRAAAITTPSQFQANDIINRRGWPADRVRVIPNPLSATILKAALQFERNGASEQVVLYTGRLAPVKGIETLLAAAKLVHDRNPGITFVLAGPWQMPRSPEAYGLKLNTTSVNGVQWVGPQDQNGLIDWYKRAALFVMPSYYESFGISVVEAMAFGLPVVASASGGLTELIGNYGAGSLVPKRDPKAFADAIIRLISATRARGEKGIMAQAAVEKFQPQRIAAETLELYQALGSSNSSNGSGSTS